METYVSFHYDLMIFARIPDSCITMTMHNDSITYFESLQYLQSVAFTVGYGHITPWCHSAKVDTVCMPL